MAFVLRRHLSKLGVCSPGIGGYGGRVSIKPVRSLAAPLQFREQSGKYTSRARSHTRQSSAGISAGLALLLALLAAYLDDFATPNDGKMASTDSTAAPTTAPAAASAGELLPGRPGSLTHEQEAKLREMWVLSGKLFGTITDEQWAQIRDSAASRPTTATASATGSAEPQKRRYGLFRRKKEEETPAAAGTSASGWSSSAVADLGSSGGAGNDKHGQAELFKQAMANSTPAELRDAFWRMTKADHPDGLLLRFLRARKWDVSAAQVMAMAALHWRLTDPKVDEEIMQQGEMGMLEYAQGEDAAKKSLGADFLEQIRLGKSFVHGFDKAGRPCCYIRVRLHHAGDQSEISQERFTVYTIETARLMLKPPVDTATIIFDMTDFGLSNMDNAPVKFMIKCFEANYPESLGVVLIHKAPWVFQGVWRVIRGWLDPVVASKINFTNSLADVSKYIDTARIPRELGGPDPFEYAYPEPVPGENDGMRDTARRAELEAQRRELALEYEEAVTQWALLAVDDEAGWAANRARRDEVAAKLERNYWALDPLVRARSLYDRLGLLPGSKPSAAPAAAATVAEAKAGDGSGTADTTVPTDAAVPTEELKRLQV